MKTKQWIYNFKTLDSNQQLEVSKAIVDELKENERYSFAVDNYDDEMSQEVRLFFNKMIKVANTKQELKKLQKVLSSFQSLNRERQSNVIESLVSLLNSYYEDQVHEEKEKICQSEGHVMGEWEYDSWTSYEDTVIDHQFVHGFECYHEEWMRTCSRCGYKEITEIEPEEVRIKREEKERQDKIKKLEKELEKLKGSKRR